MEMKKTALLLGASGLTGSCLLELLLQNDNYQKVIIYVRKSTGFKNPKLLEKQFDFDNCNESVEANDVFCCLGTTIKKAKTKEAFKKVDLEYPIKIAQIQFSAGSTKFLVVSAMGADKNSSIFYSRTKGEIEDQLQNIGYSSLTIFRPSFITGERKEKRMGESIGISLFQIINPILVGPLKKYQSVSAHSIALAMVHEANSENKGTSVLLSDEIKKYK